MLRSASLSVALQPCSVQPSQCTFYCKLLPVYDYESIEKSPYAARHVPFDEDRSIISFRPGSTHECRFRQPDVFQIQCRAQREIAASCHHLTFHSRQALTRRLQKPSSQQSFSGPVPPAVVVMDGLSYR